MFWFVIVSVCRISSFCLGCDIIFCLNCAVITVCCAIVVCGITVIVCPCVSIAGIRICNIIVGCSAQLLQIPKKVQGQLISPEAFSSMWCM